MDDWQQEWVKFWETAVDDAERFVLDVSKEMGEALDALLDFSEEVAEQVQEAIAPSLHQLDAQFLQQIELFAQTFLPPELPFPDLFPDVFPEMAESNDPALPPFPEQHPVCVGCRHYHGRIYGGNLLVCAMHPYGLESGMDTCADKEVAPWASNSTFSEDFFDDDF